jgi:hypothetical protein
MAYCAALTLHDAEGEGIHTVRYGCMPTGVADHQDPRDSDHHARIVVLASGSLTAA